MNALSPKNRASEQYAKNIFEKLFPNESERKICAKLLSDCVVLADSYGSSCWALTLFSNKIRLSVGQSEVILFQKNKLFLVITDPGNFNLDKLEHQLFIQPVGIKYKSVPINQILCNIPSEYIEEIYPQIVLYHKKYICLAAKHRKVTTWKSSFSIGIILYLNDLLKISLPIPAYMEDRCQTLYPDQLDDEIPLNEGRVTKVLVNSYERNPEARRICIEHFGVKCSVCGMNFEETYGPIGKNFIHVHHIIPLSEISAEYVVDPIKDLIPVCPNCHAMLHQRKPPYSIKEMKKMYTV
jgi:5-methylcytosine-specific restriction protein A